MRKPEVPRQSLAIADLDLEFCLHIIPVSQRANLVLVISALKKGSYAIFPYFKRFQERNSSSAADGF